jgi:hydrogenase expression/formation protein HypE
METTIALDGFTCPTPITDHPAVLMAHGGGGRMTQRLLEQIFFPAFANPLLDQRHDGAVFEAGTARLAMTTDSYVVQPLFFPGGDIGTLAINGTANDLAMCGARPFFLSAGFVLEEGLPLTTLRRVVDSMKAAAAGAGVQLVTGDTKVVDRGKGDGVYLNTSGVGIIEHGQTIGPANVRPGDVILLSGDIGRHGIAIMAAREGLELETTVESDCACVAEPALALLSAGVDVHCMRDLTRGGLASALVEIAEATGLEMEIQDKAIPVHEQVQGVCEILGFDPLYVANEGRFIVILPAASADKALAILRAHALTADARLIGEVRKGSPLVMLRSKIGAVRIVDMLSGEQLPRIC